MLRISLAVLIGLATAIEVAALRVVLHEENPSITSNASK
jgi:hypothetical protein